MGATLTTYASALKEHYPEPLIQEQLNHRAVALWHLERKAKPFGGRQGEIPIHTGRNVGVGARAENGTLPTAGNQGFAESTISTKYNYARGEITGPSIARSRGDTYAFARIIDTEMRGAIADLRQDCERQAFGDGSGVLTNVSVASTNLTTVTVSSVKYLAVGMLIDIELRSDGTNRAAGVSVDAIDATNKTISISAAATVITTDSLYRKDSRNLEMMGFGGIAYNSDPEDLNTTGVGVLQGLDQATHSTWKASYFTNSGTDRSIGFEEIQEAFDDVEILGSSYPNRLFSSHVVRRRLVRDEIVDKRYAQDMSPLELEAGFDWYRFGNIPLVPSKDCERAYNGDKGILYGISLDEMALYEDKPVGFLDYDGAILSRVSNKDAWEFTVAYYGEIATHKRNAHFAIIDIDDA